MQLIGGCPELASLKLILVFYRYVGDHYRQHLLVNIHRCHSIRHHASPGAERRACEKVTIGRVTWLSPLPEKETNDAQLFAQ
jgi:hypothetical protein